MQAVNGVIEASVSDASTVELLWTNNLNGAEFESVEMADLGVAGDFQAGDGVYTASIPFEANEEFLFYIRASNQEAMSLKPARAEYEYYIYDAFATTDLTMLNVNSDHRWTIAPNPAHETIRLVNCPVNTRIWVRDMQGRLVQELNWSGASVNVGEWSRGMYMVSSEDGYTTRLMVR